MIATVVFSKKVDNYFDLSKEPDLPAKINQFLEILRLDIGTPGVDQRDVGRGRARGPGDPAPAASVGGGPHGDQPRGRAAGRGLAADDARRVHRPPAARAPARPPGGDGRAGAGDRSGNRWREEFHRRFLSGGSHRSDRGFPIVGWVDLPPGPAELRQSPDHYASLQ